MGINWKEIEENIKSNSFFGLKFRVDGHSVNVLKVRGKGFSHSLNVYIDGYIKGIWDEKNMPVITKVWNKKTVKAYSIKERKEILERLKKLRGLKLSKMGRMNKCG